MSGGVVMYSVLSVALTGNFILPICGHEQVKHYDDQAIDARE